MNRFHPTNDKSAALTHVVSYHGKVPVERSLCYCLHLVAKKSGVNLDDALISASRDQRDISEHNQQFGTNLHSQSWLINMHRLHPESYAPADSTFTTSHCLRSDGNPAYRSAAGKRIPSGGRLPYYSRGLDFSSNGLAEWFVLKAAQFDLHFVRPYDVGSELHHVVCTHSPTRVLIAHDVIHAR